MFVSIGLLLSRSVIACNSKVKNIESPDSLLVGLEPAPAVIVFRDFEHKKTPLGTVISIQAGQSKGAWT